MRRKARRGRMFSLGLVLLLYSVIRVYSSNEITSNTPRPDGDELSTFFPKSTIIPNDDVTAFGSTQETIQSTTTARCKYIFFFNYWFFICIAPNYKQSNNQTFFQFENEPIKIEKKI